MKALESAISREETDLRLQQVRKALGRNGFTALLAYADCWRASNIGVFTDFRPVDGVGEYAQGLLLIPIDDDPTLYVAAGARAWASAVFPYKVGPLSDLADDVSRWRLTGTVGLAGADLIPGRMHAALQDRLQPRATLRPTPLLSVVKAVKTPRQLGLLQHAAWLNDHGLEAVRCSLATGRPHTERDVARIAESAMMNAGGDGVAYASMVQAGPRSSWNLALPTDRTIASGDMVLTDIGARYRGVSADGGRGFTVGPVTDRQRDIVDASASAVDAGLAAVRPGLSAADLNTVIQQVLIDRGFAEHSGEAKGHGTGHGTGIDPEEEQPWIEPGNTTALVADMVFTLKATITVSGQGGVRTERIVRVTESGAEAFDQFPLRNHW